MAQVSNHRDTENTEQFCCSMFSKRAVSMCCCGSMHYGVLMPESIPPESIPIASGVLQKLGIDLL